MSTTIAIPEARQANPAATRVAVGRTFDRKRADDAVERITARRVPESAVHLVASGLRPASSHASSPSYWDAAIDGVRVGALFGAIFAAIWSATGMGADGTGLAGMILGALAGAIFGALVAVIGRWGTTGPEAGDDDLVRADEFHVLVDEHHEQAAREALRGDSGRNGAGRFVRGQMGVDTHA